MGVARVSCSLTFVSIMAACEQWFGASVPVDRGVLRKAGTHPEATACMHASGLDVAMPLMIMTVDMSFEPPSEHSDATLYIYGSGICNPIILRDSLRWLPPSPNPAVVVPRFHGLVTAFVNRGPSILHKNGCPLTK